MKQPLEDRLSDLLNAECAENDSNTPGFILARFMLDCLKAFNYASTWREDWYGHRHAPAGEVLPAGPMPRQD